LHKNKNCNHFLVNISRIVGNESYSFPFFSFLPP